jgi:5-methylthioadenosine/S-adenosylhomocysteine deaminase
MQKILIKGGYIVTMDRRGRILKEGSILVEGDKIVEVNDEEKLKNSKADIVIDAKHRAVLPGFVNTHTHLFQTLLRSLGDDMKLFDWWPKCVVPHAIHLKKEDCYCAALAGSLELIKSGVTCTIDNHYVFPRPKLADACLEAFKDIGIRGIEARGYMDTDVFNFLPDYPELIEGTEKPLKDVERMIKEWHGAEDRLYVWFGTSAPFLNSEEQLEKTYELAKKYGTGICIHLNESLDEVKGWKEKFGSTPIKYLSEKIKFFGPNVLAIHCVHVTDEEIEILARTDTKVSHNAISNMYLASGVAPVGKMLNAGITISLGVDGAASNNNQDMFELMKTTVLLHKVSSCDPLAITAEKVLEMATIDGAKAAGLEKEIGSIEAGKKADLILFDLNRPNMAPLNRILSQLVYCGKANNVSTVIINGEIVLENGKLKTMDESEIIDGVQKASDDLVSRAGTRSLRER